MPQIKVTLSNDERASLEKSAQEHGTSLSKEIHNQLFSRSVLNTVPDTLIDMTDTTNVRYAIPRQIADKIKQNAKELGLTPSAYVTLILSQKDDPVIIRFDYMQSIELLSHLNKAADDIDTLTAQAAREGLYSSDLKTASAEVRRLTTDLTKTVNALNEDGMKIAEQMQKTVQNEIKSKKKKNTDLKSDQTPQPEDPPYVDPQPSDYPQPSDTDQPDPPLSTTSDWTGRYDL